MRTELVESFFVDTNILLDNVIPYRKQNYACSAILLNDVASGSHDAWTNDFVLSELLGELKRDREVQLGLADNNRQLLSRHDIQSLVQFVEKIKQTPNLTIYSDFINQQKVYDTVRDVCLETKDASILLSAIELGKKLSRRISIITRDERFLVRARGLITLKHPCTIIAHCPLDCGTRGICAYRK